MNRFRAILSVLVGTCITASIVDFILDVHMRKPSKDVKNTCTFSILLVKQLITAVRLLLSFSFYTNGSQILDTTPAKEGHIKSLDCIRFFSMLWVVGGHVAILFLNNGTDLFIDFSQQFQIVQRLYWERRSQSLLIPLPMPSSPWTPSSFFLECLSLLCSSSKFQKIESL